MTKKIKPMRKPLIEGSKFLSTKIEMLVCTAIAGACIGAWLTLALMGG